MKSKTTIIGAVLAVMYAIEPVINSFQEGEISGLSILKLITAGAIALLGYYSGDTQKAQ